MKIFRNDFVLISLFVLFVLFGVLGIVSVPFLQSDKSFSLALKYLLLPSLVAGGYYAFRATLGYKNNRTEVAMWRNILGLVIMSFLCSLIILKSFEGYLVLYNCNFGLQKAVSVKGGITSTNYPKKKKPLNSYSITVMTDKGKVFELRVPTMEYTQGQFFEKEMIIGSLGIMYSTK